jgi:hypothetical protein
MLLSLSPADAIRSVSFAVSSHPSAFAFRFAALATLWPINHEGTRAMDALIVDKAIHGLSAFVSHTTELQAICG